MNCRDVPSLDLTYWQDGVAQHHQTSAHAGHTAGLTAGHAGRAVGHTAGRNGNGNGNGNVKSVKVSHHKVPTQTHNHPPPNHKSWYVPPTHRPFYNPRQTSRSHRSRANKVHRASHPRQYHTANGYDAFAAHLDKYYQDPVINEADFYYGEYLL